MAMRLGRRLSACLVALLLSLGGGLGTAAAEPAVIVYPGSFDPFHLAHRAELAAAQRALAARHPEGVSAVVLPNHDTPKHVAHGYAFDSDAREELARAGTAGLPGVSVHAPFRDGTDTADQLLAVRAEHPGKAVYLLVGDDAYRGMAAWKGVRRVRDAFRVLVSTAPADVSKVGASAGVEVLPITVPKVRSHDVFLRLLAGQKVSHLIGRSVERLLARRLFPIRTRGFPVERPRLVRVAPSQKGRS